MKQGICQGARGWKGGHTREADKLLDREGRLEGEQGQNGRGEGQASARRGRQQVRNERRRRDEMKKSNNGIVEEVDMGSDSGVDRASDQGRHLARWIGGRTRSPITRPDKVSVQVEWTLNAEVTMGLFGASTRKSPLQSSVLILSSNCALKLINHTISWLVANFIMRCVSC